MNVVYQCQWMNGCFYFVIVESMEAQVYKLRHSLIGKSLIPVILRVKGFEDELQAEPWPG